MTGSTIHIRPLATVEEFRQVEIIQQQAWGMQDLTQIVPLHVTLTAQKNGGLVAGAFDEHNTMLGFVFGFIGLTGDGKFKHCSHMMGVLPEARRQNIGYRLKLFQRQYVQKQGFDLITWTFDPLEGLNAMLNIAKLGTVARKYFYNLYGDWADGINRGLPTDRFEVEWWINSQHVRDRIETESGQKRPTFDDLRAAGAETVLVAQFDQRAAHPIPEPIVGSVDVNNDTLIVEVPADFQQVKAISMETARQWRQQTARVFTQLFGRGYTVCDFLSEHSGPHRRNYFVLMRQVPGL